MQRHHLEAHSVELKQRHHQQMRQGLDHKRQAGEYALSQHMLDLDIATQHMHRKGTETFAEGMQSQAPTRKHILTQSGHKPDPKGARSAPEETEIHHDEPHHIDP
jgi:hypothetical protein